MKNGTTRSAFGAIIRARRLELGFTQKAVAAAVGWTAAQMVSLVETGCRRALIRLRESGQTESCTIRRRRWWMRLDKGCPTEGERMVRWHCPPGSGR